ncbi:UDP-glucose 4-epimerase GalE [Cylindrospermopsis raciborskii]|uniref:UDP-glucose 4-epimerase GalE n=1 Tax=Cylindrospermopsis raciborskii TaxID=77022 RepID=UPI0022BF701E|nr:UDP-glucose 4-epimerase GalE [Cylindrospermopsis raciborskii]MCZ2207552.1 UDP-glucose 4-epimerase GalE [Cylindrospermopsis raciborskii PAMP2011]
MSAKILVTGGAGYIGSHVVLQLAESGYDIVVYDNCSTGTPESVLHGELVVGDLADVDRLYQIFSQHKFSAVLHFAASLVVPESVAHPLDYYANNTRNTLNLLRCCSVMGVNQFVFSSTAAVYGQPQENPVTEESPTLPINPYGRSKLMSEWIIQDYGLASNFRYVILRYFNVAGSDSKGRIGSNLRNKHHLIANACNVALNSEPELKIFGTDFPTIDGTGVRDYIHVEDLAGAHVDALKYLENNGKSQILNCGYGKGYSVLQVIERVKAISGRDFPVVIADPRPGDPACVTADAQKIKQVLNWQPKHEDLDEIIASTIDWEKSRPT